MMDPETRALIASLEARIDGLEKRVAQLESPICLCVDKSQFSEKVRAAMADSVTAAIKAYDRGRRC